MGFPGEAPQSCLRGVGSSKPVVVLQDVLEVLVLGLILPLWLLLDLPIALHWEV